MLSLHLTTSRPKTNENIWKNVLDKQSSSSSCCQTKKLNFKNAKLKITYNLNDSIENILNSAPSPDC